ncbi:hypothetical protein [Nocardia sp. NPDC127526]|uniref:hypothetical protein n=1 Tax=Nocardia sp. NPDC127526 TaxID=3345393 RepID=UPI00363615C7
MSHAPQPDPTPLAWKEALCGALTALVAAPAAAALVATLYRFPVPLSGYARGFREAPVAALGSLFYLALGGVFLLGFLGAAGGFIASRAFPRNPRPARRLTLLIAVITALLGAIALAVLEFIVGPW